MVLHSIKPNLENKDNGAWRIGKFMNAFPEVEITPKKQTWATSIFNNPLYSSGCLGSKWFGNFGWGLGLSNFGWGLGPKTMSALDTKGEINILEDISTGDILEAGWKKTLLSITSSPSSFFGALGATTKLAQGIFGFLGNLSNN